MEIIKKEEKIPIKPVDDVVSIRQTPMRAHWRKEKIKKLRERKCWIAIKAAGNNTIANCDGSEKIEFIRIPKNPPSCNAHLLNNH